MNRNSLAIALCISSLAVTGAAWGAAPQNERSLSPITVHPARALAHATATRPLGDCTPPSSEAQCAALHAGIRDQFSKREIGMLFGVATSYPEYRTTYPKVKARYHAFVRDFRASDDASVAVAAR